VTEPTPDRIAHLEAVEAAAKAYFQALDDMSGLQDYVDKVPYGRAMEAAKSHLRRLVR